VLRLPKPLGRPRVDCLGMALSGGPGDQPGAAHQLGRHQLSLDVAGGNRAGRPALAPGGAWRITARCAADPVIPLLLFCD
jgi:hypothetical protein